MKMSEAEFIRDCTIIVHYSPESLLYKSYWKKVLHEEVYYNRIVAFVADEAHCVKKWLALSVNDMLHEQKETEFEC